LNRGGENEEEDTDVDVEGANGLACVITNGFAVTGRPPAAANAVKSSASSMKGCRNAYPLVRVCGGGGGGGPSSVNEEEGIGWKEDGPRMVFHFEAAFNVVPRILVPPLPLPPGVLDG